MQPFTVNTGNSSALTRTLAVLPAAALMLVAFVAGVLWLAPKASAITPPAIEETSVLDVAATSATFQAKIDPQGNETTYRFEYGTSEAYGASIPAPDGIVGEGSIGVAVSAHAQDLLPSTTYHYRVVAVVASKNETVPSGDATFTTQSAGGELMLPDSRQWELVSPPNKHGALIRPLSHELALIQAAADGNGITYNTNIPTEQSPQGYVENQQVLSERGALALGWSSRDISPPRGSFTGVKSTFDPEYFLFSPDLTSSLIYPEGEDTIEEVDGTTTLLSNQASEQTPYVRREALCDSPTSVSECYQPVLTNKEGFSDVLPGTKFGAHWENEQERTGFVRGVEISGASPDMTHVVLSASLNGQPPGKSWLYEWSAGVPANEAVQVVSVLPESEGGNPTIKATVGEITQNPPGAAGHAISNDGKRIVWDREGVWEGQPGHAIYLRDTARKETVRLDVRQPSVPVGRFPGSLFAIANSDDSRVFFTDFDQDERLTANAGTKEQDLYECRIVEEAGKLKCDLTDLSPASGGESAEVTGVLGASEDGSYVYFAAQGVIGDGVAHGATHGLNLYESHDGTTTFVTALSTEDRLDSGGQAARTARVSPDGRYVAFMSAASLTNYDNRDANSGKPDIEVYLYDSATGRLACVSCNPTGSRPTGVEVEDFNSTVGGAHSEDLVDIIDVDAGSYGPKSWVAANLPGGVNLVSHSSLYQPRALADSGRVFFNSSDALVSQDVNGQEDVYEYEPVGVGSCTSSSQTFHESSGGCTSLVSSGASPEESGFMDASEGGGDVFFLTKSRLASQDFDTGLDVYDAHECSSSAPCVAQPVVAPPCSSGDSCKASPSPQPSIFGAPPSATFVGAGNIAPSPVAGAASPKSLTRAQKLATALTACRHKQRHKRAACEKRARKLYRARAARRRRAMAGVRWAARATGKGR